MNEKMLHKYAHRLSNSLSLSLSHTHTYTHTHTHTHTHIIYIYIYIYGVMVTIAGNVHGDSSSKPGRDCLHFT